MPGCKAPAKWSKNNWNEASVERVHLIWVGKENQYVQVQKPMEFQRQHCEVYRFKLQEEGKTLVESRRKIAIGEQKKNKKISRLH